MPTLDVLKQQVISAVGTRRGELIRLATDIHAYPETAFQEFAAAARISRMLEENGFAVQRGVAGLETALAAVGRGLPGGPTVAFLAEYDALPGLGHACGHNLIAAAAVGAGLALRELLPALSGTVKVIGCPAEEGGGGKALLVAGRVFDGVDAALMFHPSHENYTRRGSLASYKIQIEFFGRPAHAASEPEKGINALEAMILTFNAVDALRQHLRADTRIHGIITHGGQAPNIVPDYSAGRFYVRAADTPYCTEVLERFRACADGAARATGARLKLEEYAPRYDAMLPNPKLADLTEANMAALGLRLDPSSHDERLGSTDMGNVSQVVPALHPYLAIGPQDLGGHTEEFRLASASPQGHEVMLQAARLLAMTAVDLLADPTNLAEVKQAFARQKRENQSWEVYETSEAQEETPCR